MIDVVREVSGFKPIDLTRIPEKYRPATEQMRTSFILYNKALHEIQIGHDDAAKNYLRKAVAIYPEFYDAVMVLGVLVFANGDRIGAVRIFNSVKDLDQRAVSIGILDHLVEEAERPETTRNYGVKKYASERGKAESVMGGRTAGRSVSEQSEVRYSRGQIFDKSNSRYEPQQRGAYSAGNAAPRRNTLSQSERSLPHQRERSEAPMREEGREAGDMRLLNKYLLLTIAVLLIFAVIISAMLINRMASERDLKRRLEALSSAAPSTAEMQTPTPDPGQAASPTPAGT